MTRRARVYDAPLEDFWQALAADPGLTLGMARDWLHQAGDDLWEAHYGSTWLKRTCDVLQAQLTACQRDKAEQHARYLALHNKLVKLERENTYLKEDRHG
jgi:hypothetical protein